MKVLFAGPTLFGLVTPGHFLSGTDLLCRAPAQQGDILRAVLDGASLIGLVDGRYEDVAAPWHKEILYALSRGVTVLGAASMGALRAAECAPFGMIPVGQVAARYLSGELTDDAAVAQIHAPAELGCMPLTDALVNIEATIERTRSNGALSRYEAEALQAAAKRIFFKDRTIRTVVRTAGFVGDCAAVMVGRLQLDYRDIKREDALQLVEAMRSPVGRSASNDWIFRETTAWRRFLEAADRDRTARSG